MLSVIMLTVIMLMMSILAPEFRRDRDWD